MQDIGEGHDDPEAGPAGADEPAEPEQHALLVLLDDLDGRAEQQKGERGEDDQVNGQNSHGDAPPGKGGTLEREVPNRARSKEG